MKTRQTVPFQTYLSIAKCIGIAPRGKKEDKLCTVVLSNSFSIIWVCVFIFCSCVQVHQTGNDMKGVKKEKGLALLLNSIKDFMATAFVVLLFIYGYLLRNTWKIIPSAILPVGNSEKCRFYKKYNKVSSVSLILASHFLIIVSKIWEVYGWFLHGNKPFIFYCKTIGDSMTAYSQFVTVAMIWEISNILSIRYDYLKSEIENVFSRGSMYILNERRLKIKINQIKSKYEGLQTTMLIVNKLFGKAFSVIIIYTVLTTLNCVYWGLDKLPAFHGMIVDFLHHMVQLTFMIMACDRMERCGMNIVESCYQLQGKMRMSPAHRELIHLTTYLKKLAPKFTLAGCLLVNRNTLSSLISVITSYVIILIQMK